MFKTVLIPVDISVPEDTQKLLHAARSLTKDWDCDVHIVTVIPNVGMPIVGSYFDEKYESETRIAVEKELDAAIASAQISAESAVLNGTVYDCVISHATKIDADFIIIGAHQPELRDYLLGSNAARVVRHSKQSVLVLRG